MSVSVATWPSFRVSVVLAMATRRWSASVVFPSMPQLLSSAPFIVSHSIHSGMSRVIVYVHILNIVIVFSATLVHGSNM